MSTLSPQSPILAAALITLATAFIAATSLLAKTLGSDVLGPPLHPLQISHGRFVFAFGVITLAIALMRPARAPVHWRLHLGRTTFGWMGVTLMFAAVAYIPMADATAITFLNPVFAMILAIPLLGERVGAIRWSAALIAMIGALILLRPTPESFQPAALLALGAAVVMSIEVIFIKKLAGKEPVLQILFVTNLVGPWFVSLAVLAVWGAPTAPQWVALATLGLLMACAQAAFVSGMARADASFVAPFSYATLVFAGLYDFWIFGVRPDWVSLTGMAVILTGALIVAIRGGRAHHSPRLTQ